jgi:hypothetical protein
MVNIILTRKHCHEQPGKPRLKRDRRSPEQGELRCHPGAVVGPVMAETGGRSAEFRTSGGRRVRVLYPGRAGTAAGPDFRNALLEIEGTGLVQGDVEIHLRQQDWEAHGHHNDPNYNGVVLHAALEVAPARTQLQSGQQAPVVSLVSLLADADLPLGSSGSRLWEFLEQRAIPGPEQRRKWATC